MVWQLVRDWSVWRFVLAALCAAVFFYEHVRLAWWAVRRLDERGVTGARTRLGARAGMAPRLAAWVVPGLGAYLAWRGGARLAPLVTLLSVVGWLALRPWA